MAFDGKQIKAGSIDKTKTNFTTPTAPGEPAIKSYVDNTVNNAIYALDWKASVRVASTGNVSITSAPSAIDGVTLANGDRVLLKNQTTASENGIRVFTAAGAALNRATDANTSANVTSGMAVTVEEGTANSGTNWKLTTPNPIVLDTTGLTFALFSTNTSAVPVTSNKYMVASVTAVDGDLACATGMAGTPANSGFVDVWINGDHPEIGNGVKTKACYFSGDSGVTARAFGAVITGDKLYWNGSIAGYQLAATDQISFEYTV